ncbi:MAG TPA: CoA transferase [Acidimicrobiales bacterium]|nr:CoA transferase [Acidimicrobiales bacterium]
MTSDAGPFHGIRVLDLSSVVMGPYATQLMADYGADVITIEAAGGDTNRRMGGGPHPELTGVALNLLRNKRNLAVDIKAPAGRQIVLDLARISDVFVSNLRPGPLERLGLTYEDIAAVRPDIVYATAAGFASDSERRDDPAYDDVIQAETGLVDVLHRVTGVPQLIPSLVADKVSGLTLAFAVSAALLERARTGRGRKIEVAMTEAVRSFVLVEHGGAAMSEPAAGPVGYQRILTSARRAQRSADGWICIFPYHRRHHDALVVEAEALGVDVKAFPRPRDDPSGLYQLVGAVAPRRTNAEWLAWCRERGIPAAAVATLEDLVEELEVVEHPVAGPYRVAPRPARFEGMDEMTPRPAPLIGQDTLEVLAELGYDPAQIARLRAGGVLQTPGVGTAAPADPAPGTVP